MASELVNRIRAKYPEYNDIPDNELEKRILAKYPEYQDLSSQKPSWLTGNAQSLPEKAWNAAGNILNVPSYAIGGILNKLQKGKFSPISGAVEGVKNKQSVMTELPETFGVDPNSGAGMALGFGGELLTPNIPFLGLLGKGAKAADVASDVSKAGKLTDVGKDLLLRSYKFSQTDIAKLANNLGETNPAKYKDVVVAFLQKQGLTGGATQQGMEWVSRVIEPLQKQYNALVKSGKNIDPRVYAQAVRKQAQEILSNPLITQEEKAIANSLMDYAKKISGLKTPITDSMLAARKSGSFAGVSASKISDPALLSRQKSLGFAGIEALEELSPGSKAIGKNLRGLRTAQDVIGRTANVGKGTQLINTLKAFVPGAGVGYMASQGNPLGMIAGAAGATMANNPAIQNKVARATLSFARRAGSPQIQQALKTGLGATKKLFGTGARVSMQPRKQNIPEMPITTYEQNQTTYDPITTVIQQMEKRRKNYVPAAFPVVRRK